MELPFRASRWASWIRRSKMASAKVGSPAASDGCQDSIGSWLMTSVERTWLRSSITSNRSLASMTLGGVNRKIVQYQHADLGQLRQATHIATVATAERQIRQQPRRAHVQGGVSTANRGVGQGAPDE